MTINKLRNHSSAQCHIAIDNGEINMISYVTRVVTIKNDENGNRLVECTGTYSKTTARQISWFLKEYAADLTFNQVKNIVGKGFVAM